MPAARDDLPPARRIPGVAGIEHIGLTVPDLDVATRFLMDLLGAETLYDIGPFASADDWMASHLAGHQRAQLNRLRILRIANGPMLELIELAGTGGAADGAGPAGGLHLAFYVEDMEAALAALKTHDVEIQSGPVEMTEGPSRGLTWLYFTAPWGQQLELVSYPSGVAACAGRDDIWRPQN
ncbi:MAG: VOC family protein [Hyphomicrobiaceae bacterium]